MTAAKKQVLCKDCIAEGITTIRKLATKKDGTLQPGPRCVTHWRVETRIRAKRARELRLVATYSLTAQEYQQLYEAQGGVCFICRWAKGLSKALAVDHEHDKPGCEHPPHQGCHDCVRALLCGPCNQLLGRYDVKALERAIEVLVDPPARRVLGTSITSL